MLDDTDGDAILRRRIYLPSHWKGKALSLEFGVLQSSAIVFFNGRPIHGGKPFIACQPISCEIPAEFVDDLHAEIALRLWNSAGPGGHVNPASTRLSLGLSDSPSVPPIYHSDFRADFKDGDDPYRFFRW